MVVSRPNRSRIVDVTTALLLSSVVVGSTRPVCAEDKKKSFPLKLESWRRRALWLERRLTMGSGTATLHHITLQIF